MADKNKGNTVSDRSKAWMEDTLFKLMQTEKYEEITIQEITDNAGLSRRTFYRNYTSKDEIVEGCLFKIWAEYEKSVRQQTDFSLPNIARVFFTVMQRHCDFLSLMNRHHLLSLFLVKIDELLPPAFNEIKGAGMPFPKESIEYALTFSTGGFMRILIRWLNDSVQKSPEQMETIVKDLITISSYSYSAN